ncbi:ribonuclease HI [Devosia sp. SL43]|uniref:ribonuclease HI n=1 Tax=Devosia sp. SL43 TaxID=2806348 RepID=UPI001F00E5C7|nr:ribonuclease HI [Devosia sp. SL43]UJW85100.1 ribonuclease HI [Devosia sp. SL43]
MTKKPQTTLLIYTDGACIGNPGPGGWGAVIQWLKDGVVVDERELCGTSQTNTTNNRMEMSAALEAIRAMSIEYLLDRPMPPIVIRSDSRLLIQGMTDWLPGWQRRGWRKGDGKPVQNVDLWTQLVAACQGLDITWEWVRGHADDPVNIRADALANSAANTPQLSPPLPRAWEGLQQF